MDPSCPTTRTKPVEDGENTPGCDTSPLVFYASALQKLLVLTRWLERRKREVIASLIEENASCSASLVGTTGGGSPCGAFA